MAVHHSSIKKKTKKGTTQYLSVRDWLKQIIQLNKHEDVKKNYKNQHTQISSPVKKQK